jgi:Rieske Fe-S protein
LLTDGTIVEGSASQNLLQYNYTFDSSTGVLYFYN